MGAIKPWEGEYAEYPNEKKRGEWWQRGKKNSVLTPERAGSMKAVIRALNETYSMTNVELKKYINIPGMEKEVQSVIEALALRFPLWEEEENRNVTWYGLLWKIDPEIIDEEEESNNDCG